MLKIAWKKKNPCPLTPLWLSYLFVEKNSPMTQQKHFPVFLSYLLSFSLLFTYWRSHHFIESILAKNIDTRFSNLNAIFFFFIGLVPFSSLLLGRYSYS